MMSQRMIKCPKCNSSRIANFCCDGGRISPANTLAGSFSQVPGANYTKDDEQIMACNLHVDIKCCVCFECGTSFNADFNIDQIDTLKKLAKLAEYLECGNSPSPSHIRTVIQIKDLLYHALQNNNR